MKPAPAPELSTTDWAVLAALAEEAAHGFRIAALFAPGGELGDLWRIQRPQVYRALEHLLAQGLAAALRQEEGDAGPPRTLYAATPEGRGRIGAWLQAPVLRLRHGRSDLRLKIAFLLRLGHDPRPLLLAQRRVYRQIRRELEARHGAARSLQKISLLWRLEMARASLRFVEQLLKG